MVIDTKEYRSLLATFVPTRARSSLFVSFSCLVGTVKGLDCLFDWVDIHNIDLDMDSPYGANDEDDGWSNPNSSLIDDDVLGAL